jgi:hypothetical protein
MNPLMMTTVQNEEYWQLVYDTKGKDPKTGRSNKNWRCECRKAKRILESGNPYYAQHVHTQEQAKQQLLFVFHNRE